MKLAVIPARGGSKRIPRKNIKSFCGKPMMAYSIETALTSGLFDRVIVSTEDAEIAETALEYGAQIPFMRPSELADDFTGTGAIVRHALEWYQQRGEEIDYVCCIYATAPFLQVRYLKEGFDKLVECGMSFAFSVTSFPFPIQRSLRYTEQGGVAPFFPEYIKMRSQDLEEAFHDAGQFYWGRAGAFLQGKSVFSNDAIPIRLPRYLVQDIDTNEDWRCTELMYRAIAENL